MKPAILLLAIALSACAQTREILDLADVQRTVAMERPPLCCAKPLPSRSLAP